MNAIMGDPLLYYCPLCCNSTFDSKQALVEHLIHISLNIICPLCTCKFTSLEQLTEHLRIDNCDVNSVQQIVYDDNSHELINKNSSINSDDLHDDDTIKLNGSHDGGDVGKMYVELLGKQMTKSCLQTQELKLVKEDGESRYVILTDEQSVLNPGVTIVTKQNNDGTISLTTIKDNNQISNTVLKNEVTDANTKEAEPENVDEIYSCNTCGVSFSSVLEHIQNYHNDEDVVVHEPIDECETTDIPTEFESADNESELNKQGSRKVITEAGTIIETPTTQEKTAQSQPIKVIIPIKEEFIDKSGQVYEERLVQVNGVSKSNVEDKNNVYHKVVLKDMQTTGGERLKVYHCLNCSIYVSSLADFKHRPCKILKYQCPQCPVAYENPKSLCAHMKVHKLRSTEVNYNVAPIKFECVICNTEFPTSKSLKLHKKMHDPIKSRPIQPPLETAEGRPASDDKYLCGVCDKLIPIDYRAIHQNSHRGGNKMNCDICNKKFHSREYLEMHMNVHNLDKVVVEKEEKSLPYNCLYCNRKFARPHEKVKHERIHTGEKPHSCEICGKSFRVSYCLTLHMRTHTGARPYACPHCSKRFKAQSVYNHHLLTHSNVRAYKCPFCPKAFKTSVQLAGHKNSHTKPFACQQCNRPFASLYAVRVHMEVHSRQNSLKFSCKQCGASYARAFALKDHVKQVHKDDGDPSDAMTNLKEDWLTQESGDVDADRMELNKDLSQDINELAIHATELIVP